MKILTSFDFFNLLDLVINFVATSLVLRYYYVTFYYVIRFTLLLRYNYVKCDARVTILRLIQMIN